MKLLRVFSVTTLVLIIASGSSNSINSFLSADYGKFGFSSTSLLQTTSAQQQEGGEEKEDDERDSDAAMEKEEEQGEAESKSESSTEQQQQQESSQEEERLQREEGGEGGERKQEQEQIKADCGPEEHFDSEVDLCIPDQEKVCDDDRDNDNDSRVDLEDSDCLPTKNEQEQQEQSNFEQRGEEKLSQEEGGVVDLNNDEGNGTEKTPITLEQQDNNISSVNSTSPSNYDTIIDRVQNNQNLTNNWSAAMRGINNTNNTSLNGSQPYPTASAVEANLTLTCNPGGITMEPGEQATLVCTLENKGDKPENLVIDCSGLQVSGIECYIDGQHLSKRSLINPISQVDFSILLASQSAPPTLAGTYPFDVSVVKCHNSDRC